MKMANRTRGAVTPSRFQPAYLVDVPLEATFCTSSNRRSPAQQGGHDVEHDLVERYAVSCQQCCQSAPAAGRRRERSGRRRKHLLGGCGQLVDADSRHRLT
jgi:hypothetical protein